MAITYDHKADYAVDYDLTGDHDFQYIWISSINNVSFQFKFDPALAGKISLMVTNTDLPTFGSVADTTYPPPLPPVEIASVTLPQASGSALINQCCVNAAWVFIRYTGAGGSKISIAYHGKSEG